MLQQGLQQRKYVIEICVSCYQRAPGLNSVALQLHPVYQDEENRCYFRMSASLVSVSQLLHFYSTYATPAHSNVRVCIQVHY